MPDVPTRRQAPQPPCAGIPKRHTVVGDLRSHEHFRSEILNNDRALYVWLPPGYGKDAAHYPVLYMHDGQNLFDAFTAGAGGEWGMDEIATRLIATGKMRPIIIVGIANRDTRVAEYTMTPDPHFPNSVPAGDKYIRFVIEEVKPFIDKTYRTMPEKENSAIAGSSLGALISLFIVREHPDVFGTVGSMSTSLWWGQRARIVRETNGLTRSGPRDDRIWLDVGTKEGDPQSSAVFLTLNRKMRDALLATGMTSGKELQYYEVPGADHSERAWMRRVEPMLLFFFGK